MSLAKALSGEDTNKASPPPSQSGNETEETTSNSQPMSDLLSSLSGGMDPNMLRMLSLLMKELGSNQDDKNMALISALRPFLKEKRQAKIDQAIQLAKFSRIVRVAFRTMKGGEESV